MDIVYPLKLRYNWRNLSSPLTPRNQAPSETAVSKLIAKLEAHGTVANNRPKQYARSGRSEAIIVAVQQSVENEPGTPTRRRSQQLCITRSILPNVLNKDIHLPANKVQLFFQELKLADTTDNETKENVKESSSK